MHSERGNIFVMIFIGIVLIGFLTVAIRGYSGGQGDISREDLKIQTSQLFAYGTELENAVSTVLQNNISEVDIRFSHPSAPAAYGTIATTPTAQIFSQNGGRTEYRTIPTKFLASGTGAWEFYGTTAIPQVGSNRAELIAVLPNITAAFCAAINKELGLTGQPNDNASATIPDCVQGANIDRFGPSANFMDPPNGLDPTSFSKLPMTQGCVTCGTDYHYFHVLMAR